MANAKDPQDDKHIEELLSQLQGIFGKLSKSEESEARDKVDVPLMPSPISNPPSPVVPAPPAHALEPIPPASPPPVPEPVRAASEAPMEDPFALHPPAPEPAAPMASPGASVASASEATTAYPDPAAPPPPPAPTEPSTSPLSIAPVLAPPDTPPTFDEATIACAIYYPLMREKEAKTLAQKIETMTPKFTKVSFKLKVAFVLPYEPKSDWREEAQAALVKNHIRAVFIVQDRPMEESRRRAFQAGLEPHHIYLQDVLVPSIEKKAFFTDVLLGMVFFFDSLKPKSPGE